VRSSLDETFLALGDPARLAVVRLLRKKPRRSSEIAEALSLSRPATSRHLGVLRKAGIVEEATLEEDARSREYRLRPQPFARMRTWLDEVESFWTDQLGAFKSHVEAKYAAEKSEKAEKRE
jgi:DNA-binding transcriptional ArsR family regulator